MEQNFTPGMGDSKELQMMKAALPYTEQPTRQMFSSIIRLVQVKNLLSALEQEEEEILAACSLDNSGQDREEMLFAALRPFCSKREQDLLEMFQNFRMASRFYQEYQHNPENGRQKTSPGQGFGPSDLLKNMIPPEQQNMMDMIQMMSAGMFRHPDQHSRKEQDGNI